MMGCGERRRSGTASIRFPITDVLEKVLAGAAKM